MHRLCREMEDGTRENEVANENNSRQLERIR